MVHHTNSPHPQNLCKLRNLSEKYAPLESFIHVHILWYSLKTEKTSSRKMYGDLGTGVPDVGNGE